MDRWSIVTTLNYLPHDNEVDHRAGQGQALSQREGRQIVNKMVRVADMTRRPS
jgi:cobaltochelatase CobS